MQTKASLADMLLSMAASRPDHPAIVTKDGQMTFRQAADVCVQTAHELIAEGVAPGDHVGIALRDNAEHLVTTFGIWMADAVAVPIDFRSTREERKRVAESFHLFAIVEDRPMRHDGYRSIRADRAFRERRARRSIAPPEMTGPAAPAFISLTSGTTGTPLGFVISHATMLTKTEADPFRYLQGAGGSRKPDLVSLNTLPLSFGAARNHTLLRLLNGGTVVLMPMVHTVSDIADTLHRHKVEFMFNVPTTIRGLLALAPETTRPFFPDQKLLYVGAANLTADEKVAAQDRLTPHTMTNYAATASGTIASLYGADLRARPETEGRLLTSSRVEVVDEHDHALPLGSKGILRVRAPGMATEIFGGEQRPSGDKIRDGWVYPGDIVSVGEDGFLTFHGRQSDMIVRGGVNVYPAEVENAIAPLPGVNEVAVVGVRSAREGEEIAAFVSAERHVGVAQIEAHCRKALTSDKRPRRIVLVDEFPRNANGKVVKRDLAKSLSSEPDTIPPA